MLAAGGLTMVIDYLKLYLLTISVFFAVDLLLFRWLNIRIFVVGAAPRGRPGQAQGPAPTIGCLCTDAIRLSLVARGFSQKSLALLLRPTVNRPVASFFDGLYLVGITLFALRPALDPVGIRHGEPT